MNKKTTSLNSLPRPEMLPLHTYEEAHKMKEDSAYVAEAYSR